MRILLSAICLLLIAATPATTVTTQDYKTEPIEVSSTMTSIEKRARESAVKVMSHTGHGSGGLVKYKDIQLVLTAQHVADSNLGTTYLIRTLSEQRLGVLVYSDPLHDIAVIYLPKSFDHQKGIKWEPSEKLTQVGTEITYSGYPSWHNLMTYRGYVAGYETDPAAGVQMLLNTYGWFGCSGSLVYDQDGKAIGILWGIDIQNGLPQENMIWVAPIQNLNMELALKTVCDSMPEKPRACK